MTKTNSATKTATRTAKAAPKAAPKTTDLITEVKPVKSGGDYTAVSTGPELHGGKTTLVPNHCMVGKVADAAKIGASYKAFLVVWEAAKKTNPGKLANGVDGRNAPHSAKAVSDKRGAAKATNKADKATQKPAATKTAERKAARAAKAAPKADDNRKIAIVDKAFTYGREGSDRRASWDACAKAKTVADYAKAGGKLKYLPRWQSAGAIKLG